MKKLNFRISMPILVLAIIVVLAFTMAFISLNQGNNVVEQTNLNISNTASTTNVVNEDGKVPDGYVPDGTSIASQQEFSKINDNPSGVFYIANDFTVTTLNPIYKEFTGTLDGNGKTITVNIDSGNSAVPVNTTGYAALFASFSGTLKNLTLKIDTFFFYFTDSGNNGVRVGMVAGVVESNKTANINNVKVICNYDPPQVEVNGYVGDSGGVVTEHSVYAAGYNSLPKNDWICLGGFVGVCRGTLNMQNCTFENNSKRFGIVALNNGGSLGSGSVLNIRVGGIVARLEGGGTFKAITLTTASGQDSQMYGGGTSSSSYRYPQALVAGLIADVVNTDVNIDNVYWDLKNSTNQVVREGTCTAYFTNPLIGSTSGKVKLNDVFYNPDSCFESCRDERGGDFKNFTYLKDGVKQALEGFTSAGKPVIAINGANATTGQLISTLSCNNVDNDVVGYSLAVADGSTVQAVLNSPIGYIISDGSTNRTSLADPRITVTQTPKSYEEASIEGLGTPVTWRNGLIGSGYYYNEYKKNVTYSGESAEPFLVYAKYNGTTDTSIARFKCLQKNAGTYDLKFISDDLESSNGNYFMRDGNKIISFNNLKNTNILYTIEKYTTNDFTLSQVSATKTFDNTPMEVPVVSEDAKFGMSQLVTTLTKDGKSYSGTPLHAGVYVYTFKIPETINYNGVEKTVTYTIEKYLGNTIYSDESVITTYSGNNLVIPEATSVFGEEKITLKDSAGVTIENIINVGTYSITYTIADTADYNGCTKTIPVTVNKYTTNDISFTDAGITGSGTEFEVTKEYKGSSYSTFEYTEPAFGRVRVTKTIASTGDSTINMTTVNTYKLVYTVEDTDNYNGFTKTLIFNLVQNTSHDFTVAVVDGKDQAQYNKDGYTLPSYSGSYFGVVKTTITNSSSEVVNAITDVGVYNIRYYIDETVNWAAKEHNVEVKIVPNENLFTINEYSLNNFYKNKAYDAPSYVSPEYGTVNISYKKYNAETSAYEDCESLLNIGQYKVYYNTNVNGNPNYKESSNEIEFNIIKYDGTYIQIEQFTAENVYKGTKYKIPYAVAYPFGDLTISMTRNGVAVDAENLQILDVGEYIITYKVEGTENYTGAEESITMTITQATDNDFTIKSTVPAKTFDNVAVVLPETTNPKYGKVEVSILLNETIVSEIRDAGNYTVVYKVPGTENYAEVSKTIDVVINKFTSNDLIVSEVEDFDYTGKALVLSSPTGYTYGTPVVTIKKDDVEVESIKDSGSYVVTYAIADTANYNGVEKSISFTINKLDNVISIADAFEVEYKGEAVTIPEALVRDGECLSQMKNGDEVILQIRDVGSYKIIYTSPETTNFKSMTKEVSYTVKKAKISVSIKNLVKDYNKEAYVPVIVKSGILAIDDSESQVSMTIKYNGELASPVNAGTYAITLELSGSRANQYELDYVASSLVINPININVSSLDLTKPESNTYDGNPKTVTINNTFDSIIKEGDVINLVVKYKVGDEYVTTAPSAVGNYSVSIVVDGADKNNYTVTYPAYILVISKSTYAGQLNISNITKDSFEANVTVTNSEAYTVTYSIDNGEFTDSNQFTNLDNKQRFYVVKAKIAATDVYNELVLTKVVRLSADIEAVNNNINNINKDSFKFADVSKYKEILKDIETMTEEEKAQIVGIEGLHEAYNKLIASAQSDISDSINNVIKTISSKSIAVATSASAAGLLVIGFGIIAIKNGKNKKRMSKKTLVLLVVLTMVVVSSLSLVACGNKVEDFSDVPEYVDKPITSDSSSKNNTVYTALANTKFTAADIVVKQDSVLIYSSIDGVIENPFDLQDVPTFAVPQGGLEISIQESDLNNPQISGSDTDTTLSASLKNPLNSIGINVSNANIEVKANIASNTAKQIIVSYVTTNGYSIVITIK